MRWKAFPDCYQSTAPIRLDRSAETSCRSGLWGVVQLDCIANGGEDDDDDDFDEDNYDDDDYDLAPAVSQPDCIANVGEIA